MAGSLIKIDEVVLSSTVSTVEIGGANWDSSYDVYMVKLSGVETSYATDNQINMRFLASSSPDTSSNYDFAHKAMFPNFAFQNNSGTNSNSFTFSLGLDNATDNQLNGIIYLFNFNNASEYSFMTYELQAWNSANYMRSATGGGVLTVAQATNGVQILPFVSNALDSGTYSLYGLKK